MDERRPGTPSLFGGGEPGERRGGTDTPSGAGWPAAVAGTGPDQHAPLAARMRPASLDEVLGQDEVIGPGSMLRRAVEAGRLPSLILWGPPGSGKTTLARLLAKGGGAEFRQLSAVESGVAELRGALAEARAARAAGRRTVLFVDELHRWSKSQQDAVLPHVETGLCTLIGATTENPSFEVNGALLSRCRVVRLLPLDEQALGQILRRAVADAERGLGTMKCELDPDAEAHLVTAAGGDARVALTALEFAAVSTEVGPDGRRLLTREAVAKALLRRDLRHDRAGDAHYDTISAFIKSVRGSDPDAALFWLARMLEAGEDPLFVARRLVILASEDVGLADPQALPVAVAAWQAAHFLGMPEGHFPLAQAALHLALAPKSNSVLRAYAAAAEDVKAHPDAEVPLHLRNAPTGLMRAQGYGRGYRYAHDFAGGVAEQQHLPDALRGRRYYVPGRLGMEPALAQRHKEIRRLAGRDGDATPPSKETPE